MYSAFMSLGLQEKKNQTICNNNFLVFLFRLTAARSFIYNCSVKLLLLLYLLLYL
jgi:hypothetical protein